MPFGGTRSMPGASGKTVEFLNSIRAKNNGGCAMQGFALGLAATLALFILAPDRPDQPNYNRGAGLAAIAVGFLVALAVWLH